MKQLAFMLMLFVAAGVGVLVHPIWPLGVYYLLAILRPQYHWEWALPVDWRWSLAAAMMVLASIALYLPRLDLRKRWTTMHTLVAVYACLLGLSCLTAYDPVVAQSWGVEYAKILVMAFLAMLVIDRLWHVRALAAMALIVLGYIAWEINYTYVHDGRLDVFHTGYGGMDNNGAGLLLAIGLPLAYAFGMSARRHWQRLACAALALLILHATMMTYSRGAMVASVAGVGWLLLRHRSRAQAVAIALLLALAVSFLAGKEIRERFLSTANYQEDRSAQIRLSSWSAAWQLAWDQPLTGQGIRNSNEFTYAYGADQQDRTIHCQYLQIAADAGIPAALVYLAILGLSIRQLNAAHRAAREALEQASPDRPADAELEQSLHLTIACQSGLITYMVGAVFLSLEFFELSWLLVVLANVLPHCVREYVEESSAMEIEPPRTAWTVPPRPWPPLPSPPASEGGFVQP